MSPTDHINETAKRLFLDLSKSVDSEPDTMIVLESLLLGGMLRFRPNPRHAGEFLDTMTASVIDRMKGKADGGTSS